MSCVAATGTRHPSQCRRSATRHGDPPTATARRALRASLLSVGRSSLEGRPRASGPGPVCPSHRICSSWGSRCCAHRSARGAPVSESIVAAQPPPQHRFGLLDGEPRARTRTGWWPSRRSRRRSDRRARRARLQSPPARLGIRNCRNDKSGRAGPKKTESPVRVRAGTPRAPATRGFEQTCDRPARRPPAGRRRGRLLLRRRCDPDWITTCVPANAAAACVYLPMLLQPAASEDTDRRHGPSAIRHLGWPSRPAGPARKDPHRGRPVRRRLLPAVAYPAPHQNQSESESDSDDPRPAGTTGALAGPADHPADPLSATRNLQRVNAGPGTRRDGASGSPGADHAGHGPRL